MDTLTLHKPCEALALIPHFIGFRPTHHLVFFGINQRGGDPSSEQIAMGPVMVLDIDESGIEPEAGIVLSRTIREYRVEKAVLVLYCRNIEGEFHTLKRYFRNTCALAGDAMPNHSGAFFSCFVADQSHWAEFVDEELELHTWRELDSSPAAAAMVYLGSAPPDERPSYDLERLDDDTRSAAHDAREQWLREHQSRLIPEGAHVWDTLMHDWTDHNLHADIRADAVRLGKANAALSVVGVRDRVLLWSTDPGNRSVSTIGEEELAEGLAQTGNATSQIHHLEEMVGLLDACAAAAHPDDPAALTCSAYCLWWFGQNTRAAVRLTEALRADPEYTLAELLMDAVNAAILPLWLSEPRKEQN